MLIKKKVSVRYILKFTPLKKKLKLLCHTLPKPKAELSLLELLPEGNL